MLRLAAAVGIIALGGLYGYVRMGHGDDDTFSERYLAMASARPDELKKQIAAVIPECLPKTALAHMKTQPVTNLTVLTFMKSAALLAEGKDPGEASEILIPYLTRLGEQMTHDDQQSYLAVFKNGGAGAGMQTCVWGALKASMPKGDVGSDAEKWQLRL